MYTASDLKDLGKQLADDHVKRGEDLNEGLNKVAQQKDLTRQQVDRVAEIANVESYLRLMKTADNSYVEFDLADPSSVEVKSDSMDKAASAESDYDSPPKYEFDLEALFGSEALEEEERFDKTASLNNQRELREKVRFLEDKLAEEVSSYESEISNLAYQVKQAHLQGTDFKSIYNVVKQAAQTASDHFWPVITKRLEKSGIDAPEDIEEIEKTANPDSDLYQKAQLLDDKIIKTAKVNAALEHYRDEFSKTDLYDEDVQTQDLEKIGGVVGGTLRFIGEHPELSGTTVLGTALYQAGKTKGKEEQGEVIYNVLKKNKRYGTR